MKDSTIGKLQHNNRSVDRPFDETYLESTTNDPSLLWTVLSSEAHARKVQSSLWPCQMSFPAVCLTQTHQAKQQKRSYSSAFSQILLDKSVKKCPWSW